MKKKIEKERKIETLLCEKNWKTRFEEKEKGGFKKKKIVVSRK